MQSDARKTLDERQHRAIDLLLSGKTRSATCAELGIDISTLWRWSQLDEFRWELGRRRDAAANMVDAALEAAFEKALLGLQVLALDKNNPPDVREKAFATIVNAWEKRRAKPEQRGQKGKRRTKFIVR